MKHLWDINKKCVSISTHSRSIIKQTSLVLTHYNKKPPQEIYFPNTFAPNIMVKRNKTRKIKNKIFAIEAAPAAIPVKPNIAAIIAITTKIIAHLSIMIDF